MLHVVASECGVAQLGNVVYVLHRRSSIIKTFSVDTLSPLGEDIHVEGMRDPNDMVVSDRHLYVADLGHCIWRVSADDHSYVKWLSTTEESALSVTSRGLLVTSLDSNSLREYSTADKQLLRYVNLPEYVQRLLHGVETLRGTFIISYMYLGTSQSEQKYAVSELFSCHHISDRVLSRHLLGIPPMCPKVR